MGFHHAYRSGKWECGFSHESLLSVVYRTGTNPLDEPRPVLAVPLGWFIGPQDARDHSVLVCLFPLTPTNVAVVAIVPDHLRTLVGHMGTHGR